MRKNGKLRWGVGGALLLVVLAMADAASACAVCFGKTDSQLTQAANGAILFMLAVLVPVLGGFLAFIVYLARRQSRLLPEHELLEEMMRGDEAALAGQLNHWETTR